MFFFCLLVAVSVWNKNLTESSFDISFNLFSRWNAFQQFFPSIGRFSKFWAQVYRKYGSYSNQTWSEWVDPIHSFGLPYSDYALPFILIIFLLGIGRIFASADVPHFFDIRIRVLSADVLRMSIFSIFWIFWNNIKIL